MSKPALGFIGLGKMGAPMSKRLMEAGHTVYVFDRDEAALAHMVSAGAKRMASVKGEAKRRGKVRRRDAER